MTMAKEQVCRIKPITSEMIHSMTPDQRKTLHKNANKQDSPTARAILALMSENKAAIETTVIQKMITKTTKKTTKKVKQEGERPTTSRLVVFGRTS